MLRLESETGWWLVTHPDHARLAGNFAVTTMDGRIGMRDLPSRAKGSRRRFQRSWSASIPHLKR
jgi:hypothetical protein